MDSGKEKLLTKTHELKMQLGECSKKLDALWEQKSGILSQVRIALLSAFSKKGEAQGREC